MKKEDYEISLWADHINISGGQVDPYFTEEKIAVIGSNTMTSLCRALEPKLVETTNGAHTFTFKMNYWYRDEYTGEKIDNPFLPLLVNERKVKVQWKNQWYDFIIKNCQEDSNGKSITYTCKDLYSNELAKTGFDIVLDTELQNNMGTADRLAEKVLEGTDWTFSNSLSDYIIQEQEEPVYESQLVASKIVGKVINETETAKSKDGKEKTVTITSTSKSKFLLFYSEIQDILDKSEEHGESDVQFLFSSDGSFTTESGGQLVYKSDCYLVKMFWYKPTTDYIGNIYFKVGSKPDVGDYWFMINTNAGLSDRYRGNRLVKSQLTRFDPVTEKNVKVYLNPKNNHEIYEYSESVFNTPDTIANLITNSKNFNGVDGWTCCLDDKPNWTRQSLLFQLYPLNYVDVDQYNGKGYIIDVVKPPRNNFIFNNGIQHSSSYIPNGFAEGEKYIFRIKAKGASRSGSGYEVKNYITNTTVFNPQIRTYKNNPNQTYYPVPTDEGGINYFKLESKRKSGDWLEYTLKCSTACTRTELYNNFVGIFIETTATGNEETIYALEEVQFFKYDTDINGKMIEPNSFNEEGVAKIRYVAYDHTDSKGIKNKDDIHYSYSDTSFASQYEKVYSDTGYTKVRSITASKSNRFNILQDIAETFQCWLRFKVDHDASGAILRDKNGKLQKKVYFVNEIGQETGIGFIYGMDLKTISRTIQSDQIVTKTIVPQNNNEFAQNGFCTIARASENKTKTNFILNFGYYISQGLLDGGRLNADLYLYDGAATKEFGVKDDSKTVPPTPDKYTTMGYYLWLKKYNTDYDKVEELLANKKMEAQKFEANKKLCEDTISALENQISSTINQLLALAPSGATFGSLKYIQFINKVLRNPSDYQKAYGLVISYQNLIQEKSTYSDNLEKTNATLNKINAKIEEQTQEQENIVERLEKLNEAFYNKYSRFLQEGTWSSDQYYDDNLYYLDAQSVAYTSSRPQISYNISVLRLSSLPDFKYKVFKLGDIAYVQDTEFFGYTTVDGVKTPYKEQVLITEITSNFDDPSKDSFKVQNYKTQFEDLFQRIAATTQSLQFKEGEYQRAADIVQSDGTIAPLTLAASLAVNQDLIIQSDNELIRYDETGITLTDGDNPIYKTHITSKGIFISTDNGSTWRSAIRGNGINTDALTAGIITTGKINILDGNYTTFRWDEHGINAYVPEGSGYSENDFVRFDHYGIYGILNAAEDFFPKSENEIWEKGSFGMTWKGFFLNNSTISGKIEVSSLNDILVTDKDGHPRIKIGRIAGDEVLGYEYGIKISNDKGASILETSKNGELWLTEPLHITSTTNSYDIRIGYLPRVTLDGTITGYENFRRVFDAEDKFIIWEDGSFKAKDGEMINGRFQGEVEADSGYFRGKIEATEGYFHGSLITTKEGIEIYDSATYNSDGRVLEYNNLLFGVQGDSEGKAALFLKGNGNFTGTVTAEAGYFRGVVNAQSLEASSGKIGGFIITDTELYSSEKEPQQTHPNGAFERNYNYFYYAPKFVRTNDSTMLEDKTYYINEYELKIDSLQDRDDIIIADSRGIILGVYKSKTEQVIKYIPVDDTVLDPSKRYYEYVPDYLISEKEEVPKGCIPIGYRPEAPNFEDLNENGVYQHLEKDGKEIYELNTSNLWKENLYYTREKVETEDPQEEKYVYKLVVIPPEDWEDPAVYGSYFTNYKRITSQPEDWEEMYFNYYIPIQYYRIQSQIRLDGTNGTIYAGSIVLGTGAEIESYIRVGSNSYWLNANNRQFNGLVLGLNLGTSQVEYVGNLDSDWTLHDYYERVEIHDTETTSHYEYILLQVRPSNWDTTYKNYYIKETVVDNFGVSKESLAFYNDGRLQVGTLDFNGKNSTITGNNWYISPNKAHFQNVDVSGKIMTSVFEINKVQAVGGSMIFKPSFKVTSWTQSKGKTYVTIDSDFIGNEDDYCYLSFEGQDFTDTSHNELFKVGIYELNTSNEWKENYYYEYTKTSEEPLTYDYILVQNKPEDWETFYNRYFFRRQNILEIKNYTEIIDEANPPIAVINFGVSNDLVMGINAGDGSAGPLSARGLTISHLEISETDGGAQLVESIPNLFLGELSSIYNLANLDVFGKSELDIGYGLYSDNVYLRGGIYSAYEKRDEDGQIIGYNELAGFDSNTNIKSEVIPYFIDDYFALLAEKPDDWEGHENNYYYKENGYYSQVAIDTPFIANTYFAKVENDEVNEGDIVIFSGATPGNLSNAKFQVTSGGYVYSDKGFFTSPKINGGSFVGSSLSGSILKVNEIMPLEEDKSLNIANTLTGVNFVYKPNEIEQYDTLKIYDNGFYLVNPNSELKYINFGERQYSYRYFSNTNPVWDDGIYFKQVWAEGDFVNPTYILLEEKPDDWDVRYNSYYTRERDGLLDRKVEFIGSFSTYNLEDTNLHLNIIENKITFCDNNLPKASILFDSNDTNDTVQIKTSRDNGIIIGNDANIFENSENRFSNDVVYGEKFMYQQKVGLEGKVIGYDLIIKD